jgi:hypothetical protein
MGFKNHKQGHWVENNIEDIIHCHFPTLLTIVDNSCLNQVYNNGSFFIAIQVS